MALFSRRQERDNSGPAAPPRPSDGAARSGPVSRPVPVVTGPTPIVELHDSLLHTATPRYIGVIGVAATLIVGVAATFSSFTDDGLRNLRPHLTEALVIALGVAAFGCLWWATFATINGRRVTRGRTVGPLVPMFVYVSIAVAYLAINATVHGDARVWTWVGWSLATFAAHSFVIVVFKSSAETIGNPTTHFTQVAVIPIAMAAAVSVGVGFGVLRGIPFLAVPLLMAWMVPELFRAMHGWDRACAQRMKVMLRDFSYDTPSGSVPAVASPHTGQTPVTAARPQPPMQVASTEPPQRVAGTHHPVRPTWNPVEEARQKAEQLAAAAVPGGAAPSTLDAYMSSAGMAPQRVQSAPRRRHHTQIPKLMVTLWVLSPLISVPVLALLERQGHIEGLYSENVAFDELGRAMLLLFGAAPTAGYFVGWMWWATASLANVRQRSQNAPWPGIVAASQWAVVGGLALAGAGRTVEAVPMQILGFSVAMIAYLYCYFGVLSSLRKAAGIIGAPKEPWTTLMKIPFYVVGTAALGLLFLVLTHSIVLFGITVVLCGSLVIWGLVSFVRAVWSFDRVCRAPVAPRVEEEQMPLFLRQAMGVR